MTLRNGNPDERCNDQAPAAAGPDPMPSLCSLGKGHDGDHQEHLGGVVNRWWPQVEPGYPSLADDVETVKLAVRQAHDGKAIALTGPLATAIERVIGDRDDAIMALRNIVGYATAQDPNGYVHQRATAALAALGVPE